MSFWDSEAIAKAEEERQDFSAIPAGQYTAVITDAEVKATKSGGHRVSVRYDITGPTMAGRVLFDSINVNHSNPTVVGIGLGQIKALCLAAGDKGLKYYEALKGVANWGEAEAMLDKLHSVVGNIPLSLNVTTEESETYGTQNRIKSVKAGQAAAPTVEKKAAGKKNPWD